MARIVEHLPVAELEARYRAARGVTEARHYQAIWLLAQGRTFLEVAEVLAFVPRWVERLVVLLPPGDPMDRRVEVRADMLARFEPVPVPGRAALIVAADLMELPPGRVGQRRRELQDRRRFGERL